MRWLVSRTYSVGLSKLVEARSNVGQRMRLDSDTFWQLGEVRFNDFLLV